MYSQLLDRDSIAKFLDDEDDKGAKNALTLNRDDPRVEWDTMCEVPSEENPSIDVGQEWSVRCKLGESRALHVEGRGNVVVIHVDKHDPADRPVRHLVEETNLLSGALVGLGLGLLATALGAPPKLALAGGASVGAAIGGTMPVKMKMWQFDGVGADGRFTFNERVGVTPRLLLASG